MNLSEFNFNLPPERIAQRPLDERDASRLLLLNRASGAWEDRHFREFPDLLRGDELIVINNARVLPARVYSADARESAPSRRARIARRVMSTYKPRSKFCWSGSSKPTRWETLVLPEEKFR